MATEPAPAPDPSASASRLQPGQVAAIWGVVAVAWAVFLLPPFFGAVGFALGGYAWWRGERRGRWIMIVHPRFKSPAEIALNLAQWPGTPPEAPSAPQWKLLFSPKVR